MPRPLKSKAPALPVLVSTNPDALSPDQLRSSNWRNIWCAGYNLYTPISIQSSRVFPDREWDGTPKGGYLLDDANQPVTVTLASGETVRVTNGIPVFHHMEPDLPWLQPSAHVPKCSCPPGPQARLDYYLRGFQVKLNPDAPADWKLARRPIPGEILLGGGRGSGKSELFFLCLQRGNPNSPDPKARNFLNHPGYRCLILRKHDKDLDDFFRRCETFFQQNGFEIAGINHNSPKYIQLKSGAFLAFGHLKDQNSFANYIGHEYHFVWIEELGLISKEDLYQDIKTCVFGRSKYEEILPLVCSSTNPGGPGAGWVEDRFVHVQDPSDPTHNIPWGSLIRDPISGIWRVYLHSSVFDNPYTLSKGYDKFLRSIPNEAKRKQWLEGSWDIKSGIFFTEFRKRRIRYCSTDPCSCKVCEPNSANHVIDLTSTPETSSIPQPYDPLILGGDLGFGHHTAFVKLRIRPNGRVIQTGEKLAAGVTIGQWGVAIGEWIGQELSLLPNKTAILFLSHEAFGQRGNEFTQAQQFQAGLNRVLGKDASIILTDQDVGGYGEINSDERAVLKERANRFWSDLASQRQLRVVIRRSTTKRVDSWFLMRDLLRWNKSSLTPDFVWDPVYANELILAGRTDDYLAYVKAYQQSQNPTDPTPKLLISHTCERTIEMFGKLVSSDKNVDDVADVEEWWNDLGDALRYAIAGHDHISKYEPEALYVARELQRDLANGNNPAIARAIHTQKYRANLHRPPAAFSIDRANGGIVM